MREKELRSWKKVFESDLSYISYELKDIVEKPAVIVLEGEMGVGKTTFAKNFIDDESSSSPSYSIINEHKDIAHADFYRIEDREDIFHLELPLYLEDKNYFLLEWGKKHLSATLSEIPDSYNFYLLSIIKNKEDENGLSSRNFELFLLEDL